MAYDAPISSAEDFQQTLDLSVIRTPSVALVPGDVLAREGVPGLFLTQHLQSDAIGVWSEGDMVQWPLGSFSVSRAAEWAGRAPMPRGTRLLRKAVLGEIRGYFGLEEGTVIHDLGAFTLVVNDTGRMVLWPTELIQMQSGPAVGPRVPASYRLGSGTQELDLASWLNVPETKYENYSLILKVLGISTKLTSLPVLRSIFKLNHAPLPADGILDVRVKRLPLWIAAMDPVYLPDLGLRPNYNSPRIKA